LHSYSRRVAPTGDLIVPRSQRLTRIAELIAARRFSSQEELARALSGVGIDTTQATLSRDLRSLGVAKRAGADGVIGYELPLPGRETLDRQRQALDLRAFVNDVRIAQNLLVVRTPPGHANGVGRAIDLAEFDGVVGTVAGDDTVLIVVSEPARAKKLKRTLDGYSQGVTAR
jgi:transcriptional regulator of arginine metabolism